MQKNRRNLSVLAFATIVAGSVSAQDAPTADTVVATVNGTEIMLGHMIVARATLPEQYQQLADDVLFKGILDQLIQQTALSQSLKSELPKRIELSLENEKRSLLAGEAVEVFLKDAVSEEAVQNLYDAKYGEFEGSVEYEASHILVETLEEAEAVKEALDAGADFAETAREKSTGPSGPSGGELGWFGPGMMVAPFETAVSEMKAGDVSAPVQTQFGWHIIRLNETRQKPGPALDEVRSELETELQRNAADAYISELTAAATIDRSAGAAMDPSVLKNLDILEN